MRPFSQLNPREVIALAMEIERNNAQRLETFFDQYEGERPALASFFATLRDEELEHLTLLKDFWQEQFGSEPPPAVDEMEVDEVVEAVDLDHGEHLIFDDLDLERAFVAVRRAELQAETFYRTASANAADEVFRNLYTRLADLESGHRITLEAMGRDAEPQR